MEGSDRLKGRIWARGEERVLWAESETRAGKKRTNNRQLRKGPGKRGDSGLAGQKQQFTEAWRLLRGVGKLRAMYQAQLGLELGS